jgi:hypothetical protein
MRASSPRTSKSFRLYEFVSAFRLRVRCGKPQRRHHEASVYQYSVHKICISDLLPDLFQPPC